MRVLIDARTDLLLRHQQALNYKGTIATTDKNNESLQGTNKLPRAMRQKNRK